MKKTYITRIVLGVCLLLATVGFIVTQGKGTMSAASDSSKTMSDLAATQTAGKVIDNSSYYGESEEEQQEYYSSTHALEQQAFERMQTGGKNKKIYYSAGKDKYHWVMATDVKRYYGIPEECKKSIELYEGKSVSATISKDGLNMGDIQSQGYMLIEVDFLVSNNFQVEFVCNQDFKLYSMHEDLKDNYSEGTLLADDNLIYVDVTGTPRKNNTYTNTFRFTDQGNAATFRIIYLLPTEIVEKGDIFIGGSCNIYQKSRSTYTSSAYVIRLDE